MDLVYPTCYTLDVVKMANAMKASSDSAACFHRLLAGLFHPRLYLPRLQGRGGQLLRHIEATLKTRGARLLLVETLASFEQARAFYRKNGFEEEACIRDFYDAGDDKVVFRKMLK